MHLGQTPQDVMIDLELPGGSPVGTTPDTGATYTPPSMGVTPSGPQSSDILNAIAAIGKSAASVYQTVTTTNLNQQLIRSGRPPLTPAQMAALSPQFNIGLAGNTQNLLIYGGLAFLAVMLLSGAMRGRRA